MVLARAHLIVEGRVQGVFFRQNTVDRARAFKLSGWVKNRYDGAVEVLAEGEEEAVKKLVNWCHQGPRSAVVTKVTVNWQPYLGEFRCFEIAWG